VGLKRSLFDARDEAAEAIRDSPLQSFRRRERADGDAADGEIDRVVDEAVRQAVTAYVLEAEPLLQNTEAGQEVWHDAGLQPAALEPPASIPWDDEPSYEVGGVPESLVDEKNDVIRVPGVAHYVSLETPFSVTWTGQADTVAHRRHATERVEEPTLMTLPRSTSEGVFRATNKLLADLGIGIDAEVAADDEASFDYSDLL